MSKQVQCQCGNTVRGKDDEELIANVQKHAREIHGGMEITPEQVLAMAQPETQEG